MNVQKNVTACETIESLETLADECHRELFAIADWWIAHAVDVQQGGFVGEINADSQPCHTASKGVVLNSRLLWFFSELARVHEVGKYREMAERAYEYLHDWFLDTEYGGYVWELDCAGNVLRDRKQVYGQAFCLYGLVSYYQSTQRSDVLEQALKLFRTLESHAVDRSHGGYIDAFSRSWGAIEDVRLSEIEPNYPKTMNTHLHLLEAYTSLHRVVGSDETARALEGCVRLFEERLLDLDDLRLKMFFDLNWNDHSREASFGHEVEFSWLICKACEALGNDERTRKFQSLAVQIADRVLRIATGPNGEICERAILGQSAVSESSWWVQAESLVGFLNAYELSGDSRFAFAVANVWRFIKGYHKNSAEGEWTWAPTPDGTVDRAHYLGGFWKGPYHNGRAMLEVTRRLSSVGS